MSEAFATKEEREAGAQADLSAEIIRSIGRSANEQVTCRRITQNYYRCNWWTNDSKDAYDNPGMTALLVTTSRITRSQFIHVVKSAGELKITNRSTGTTPARG